MAEVGNVFRPITGAAADTGVPFSFCRLFESADNLFQHTWRKLFQFGLGTGSFIKCFFSQSAD
jgi:hypothetical protein